DVKPANLIRRADGVVKVVDLGLAKLADRQAELTGTGDVLGTPDFMAPEQVDGRPAGHPADVFGLGGTVHYLLTGRPATPPGTLLERAQWLKTGERPDLGVIRADVPPELADLVCRMLAADPNDRPTMAAVAEELYRIAAGLPVTSG